MIYDPRNCPEQRKLPANTVCTCPGCETHRDVRYRQRLRELIVRDDAWQRDQEQRKRTWLDGRRPRGVL